MLLSWLSFPLPFRCALSLCTDTEAARSQPIAEAGKPFILSVSSSSVSDCLVMLDNIYASSGIAAVELNLASTCASGKSVVAYDFQQMESTLSMVCSHVHHGSIPLGVKLAPYFDDGQFDRAASILAKFPIRFIVCSGAIGQGLAVDAEQECEGIEGAQGIGKMAGGFLKHIALANVRKFFLLMQHNGRPDIDIVGVGGVHSGEDAFELLLCGASAVQVGTCHWAEGPPCFRRINSELLEIMRRKGYSSLEQFRGRLEHFSARPASLNATKSEQGTDGKRILLKLGRVELIDDNRPGPTAANNVLLMIIIVITAIAFHFFQEAQKCS